MPFMNKRNKYGWSVIFLHWLLFVLIAGLVAGGKFSASLDGPDKIPMLIGAHKQVGVAVLVLMAFRLLWRLINTGVESLSESGLLTLLAKLTHWGLYLVVMGQAVIGIAMSQAGGREVTFLGVIKVPDLGGDLGLLADYHEAFADAGLLRTWHEYGGYAIGALVGLHLLGALVHHFVWRDETLRRMWFGYVPPYEKEARSAQP